VTLQIAVYMLRCSDGSYYTGITRKAPLARVYEHNTAPINSYTARRRPVVLVFTESYENLIEAIMRERQIKGWSRRKKEALIRRDYDDLPDLASRSPHAGLR
jgi:putative endonuclease